MAEWALRPLNIPPEIQPVLDTAAIVAEVVGAYLDAVATALEYIADIAQAALDTYRVLVNTLIDAIQAFLDDLRFSGIYVLADYPSNLNIADFNPVAATNLDGTVFDRVLWYQERHDDVPVDFQAVAARRNVWNPSSKNLFDYPTAVSRLTGAFGDVSDPLRPQFSDSAATVGVVIMAWSTEVAVFLKLVRQITSLFAITDLAQLEMPALGTWFSNLEKSLGELTESELCNLDFTVPLESRNSGAHPNWVGRFTLQDLMPSLGELLQELAALLELFRPNGDITKFIQDLITAIRRKVTRLQQLVATLNELADLLRNGFQGTSLASVVVESTTGNRGFISGLQAATGAPEFKDSLVCSVVLYAGGASAETLRLLFSSSGRSIRSEFVDNIVRQQASESRTAVAS